MITVTVKELEAHWRPLTESEQESAEQKLKNAVVMLYSLRRDLDDAIQAGDVLRDAAVMVVCEMVEQAMRVPDGQPANLSSQMQVAGPYTVQNAYRDTGGKLYLTRNHRRMLGIRRKASMTDISGLAHD